MVAAAVALAASGCAVFRPRPEPPPVVSGTQVGVASWYGPGFHGRQTASGEIFDQNAMTAAHPSLPLGTRATVTSLANHRSVAVRINDRGPFVDDRIVDLSYAAARSLDMIGPGIMRVRLDVVAAAPPRRAARTKQPARSSPPPPVEAYFVQLGAYRQREAADGAQREIARRFPDAHVTSLDAGGERSYRVQLGPYAALRSAAARAEVIGRLGYPATVLAEPGR
jgi:rare lipoprotein A